MAVALSVTQASTSCSEHELVAAVRCGDDRAFEELYSRFGRRISAYIYGMVGDHGRAEDITQEVFISALRRMRDSERPIAFKPWIYEIAKNACIDEFRRARRAREVPIGDDDLEQENPRLVGRAQTPEAAIENSQQLTDLRGAFRGLSESHHQIIVLRELEGLSYTEIGERMGMTRPVVESTLFRARRRLGEEYEELVSGRRCVHVQEVITERGPRAFRSLGIKQRRLVARHLAHCQPCRRHAHMHGFDDSVMQPPTVIGKIAALLPIPAFLRWRRGATGTAAGSHAGRAAAAARSHAFNALQSAQSVSAYVDPSAPAGSISRVAAAAATIAIAGAGGGIVAATSSSTPHRTPSIVRTGGAHGAGGAAGARAGHAVGAATGGGGVVAGTRSAQHAGKGGVRGTALSVTNSGSRTGAQVGAGAPGRGGSVNSTSAGGGSQPSSSGSQASNTGSSGLGAVTGSSGVGGVTGGGGSSNVIGNVLKNAPKVQLPNPNLTLPKLPQVTLPPVNLPSLPGASSSQSGASSGTGSGVTGKLGGILGTVLHKAGLG